MVPAAASTVWFKYPLKLHSSQTVFAYFFRFGMFKYPIVCEGRSPEEIQKMEDENALPHGWEKMLYDEFLIERRKLMAAKIKKAFEILKSNAK